MKRKPVLEASEKYLRSAQPRLICRVDPEGTYPEGLVTKLTPHISEAEPGRDEILEEGYDPDHSPLRCPVYWRIVNRGDEQLYCSTVLATRAQVTKLWGTEGLAYCDPITGMAVARIETNLRGQVAPISSYCS